MTVDLGAEDEWIQLDFKIKESLLITFKTPSVLIGNVRS
jgi:hypothetical protein